LLCGAVNWDMVGRKTAPKGIKPTEPISLWSPHHFLPETRVRFVASSASCAHNILITEEGKAMTFGRNDKGKHIFKFKKKDVLFMPDLYSWTSTTCLGGNFLKFCLFS